MAPGPSKVSVFWPELGIFWPQEASDILNEQGLGECIQKSAPAPSAEDTNVMWGFIPWGGRASEILNEQALGEAE